MRQTWLELACGVLFVSIGGVGCGSSGGSKPASSNGGGGPVGGAATSTGGTSAGGNGPGGTANGGNAGASSGARTFDLPIATYTDKLEGGWIGQMAAGRWMQSMEFNGTYSGKSIAPESALTTWTPSLINVAFGDQADETWAEIPYLDALYKVGAQATWVDFGNSWRDSTIPDGDLYSANLMARNNLRAGMQAPESGYFTNTGGNAENQTWEMESNWTGMIAPGMVNAALDVNWRAGHVALFGDALNGGAMVTAMQSTAFYATTLDQIIQAGRNAVPKGSHYRDMIEDVIGWHAATPNDYAGVWQKIEDKWSSSNGLDTKINGAMMLLALLFGNGKFEDTVKYAGRAGWDGDCTANDAGSIIGTWLGLSKLDPTYSSALDRSAKFVGQNYTYDDVISHSTEVARKVVQYVGGKVTGSGSAEVWTIPIDDAIVPPILEQWPRGTNAPPVLADITSNVSGREVTFSASATSAIGILGYQWYFGDLSHSATAIDGGVTHTFARAGSYYVIAYTTDKTGNTAWKSTLLQIP